MPSKQSNEHAREKKPLSDFSPLEKSKNGSSNKNNGSYRHRFQRAKNLTGSSNGDDRGADMVRGLKEIFPGWSVADLRAQLDECHQDVELVINRISSGAVSNWQKSGVVVKRTVNQNIKVFADRSKKRNTANTNQKASQGKPTDTSIADSISVSKVSIESSVVAVAAVGVNSSDAHDDAVGAATKSNDDSSINFSEIEQLESAVSGLVVAESSDDDPKLVADTATSPLDTTIVLKMPIRVTSRISTVASATVAAENIQPVVILPTKANCRPRTAVNRGNSASISNQSSNMIGDFFSDLRNSASSFHPSSNSGHPILQKLTNGRLQEETASSLAGSIIRRPHSSPDQKAIRRPDSADLPNSSMSSSPRIPPGIGYESANVYQDQRSNRSVQFDSSASSTHFPSIDVRFSTENSRFNDSTSDIQQYRPYAATEGISCSQSYGTDYSTKIVSENHGNVPHRNLKQNWNAYNQNAATSMAGNRAHNFGYHQPYQPQQYSSSSFYSQSSLYADDLDANSISSSATQNHYQLPQPLYSGVQRSSPSFASAYSSSSHHQNASMSNSMYYRSGSSLSMNANVNTQSPHRHQTATNCLSTSNSPHGACDSLSRNRAGLQSSISGNSAL